MLELRPSCEHCNKALPPESLQSMICTYECTFCRSCVEDVLENVCPNCGGGFSQRPHRPSKNLKDGNCLANNPASTTVVHHPVNPEAHRKFAAPIRVIAPHKR